MQEKEVLFLAVLGGITLTSLLIHYITRTLLSDLKDLLCGLVDLVAEVWERIKKRFGRK